MNPHSTQPPPLLVHPPQMHIPPPPVNAAHHIANMPLGPPPMVVLQHNKRDSNRLNHQGERHGSHLNRPPPQQQHSNRSSTGHNSIQQQKQVHQTSKSSHSNATHLPSSAHTKQQQIKQQQSTSQSTHKSPAVVVSKLMPQTHDNNKTAGTLQNGGQQHQQQQPHQPVSLESASVEIISSNNTNEVPPQTQIILSNSLHNSNETLANIKEKTPMCLVNELARYNKIQHQYRLTGEQGPAHKKNFTVTLKLGDEEYTSDGQSIKKAQHAAASEAIKNTKYKHPPAKSVRKPYVPKPSGSGNITPTVELNALAMKRGEATTYVVDPGSSGIMCPPPPQTGENKSVTPTNTAAPPMNSNSQGHGPKQHYVNPQAQGEYYGGSYYHHRGGGNMYHPRYMHFDRRGFGRPPKYDPHRYHTCNNLVHALNPEESYRITLHVGSRNFLGIGNTLQAARHDAASKALEVLKPITLDAVPSESTAMVEDPNAELKSPISLVHEMALKRNLTVIFDVQSEKGPPHMKMFITVCKVGNLATEGEGNGKKLSKKRAAEKMIEELKQIPPPSPNNRLMKNKRKPTVAVKKKTRNLIKDKVTDSDIAEGANPISRLIQMQQARKEKEPVYTLLEERGVPRKREFVMEVSVSGQSAQGVAANKKHAKKIAAENLLKELGYGPTTVFPVTNNDNTITDDTLASVEESSAANAAEKSRKVTFQEATETVQTAPHHISTGGSAGRQLVPGLILVHKENSVKTTTKSAVSHETTATIAKELLNTGTSPTGDTIAASSGTQQNQPNSGNTSPVNSTSSSNMGDVVRSKDQLMYLAQLLGFHVSFSDFPKGNHGEFLTLVQLSTDPPQICHGAGASVDASHDAAATTILKILSELGLDNLKPKKAKPILSTVIKK